MRLIKLATPIQIGDRVYTELDLSEPIVLTLGEPVRLGDVEYTELSLREPTVGQLEDAQNATTATAANITLIAKVCNVPPSMVKAMKQGDYLQAVAFFSAVATAFQPTGATS